MNISFKSIIGVAFFCGTLCIGAFLTIRYHEYKDGEGTYSDYHPGVVQIGNSLLLTDDSQSPNEWREDFLRLTRSDWIQAILNEDVNFSSVVVDLERLPYSAEHLLGPEGIRKYYSERESIPSELREYGLIVMARNSQDIPESFIFFRKVRILIL